MGGRVGAGEHSLPGTKEGSDGANLCSQHSEPGAQTQGWGGAEVSQGGAEVQRSG